MNGQPLAFRLPALIALLLSSLVAGYADDLPSERVFSQSKAAVDKAVKAAASEGSGRLPVLDGFAEPGAHPLDHYQKGFYQCTAQVISDPSGGTRVKVTAKITAWYSDNASGQSGYQVLRSNGRLESDFLDRVQDALGTASSPASPTPAPAGTSHAPNTSNASAASAAKFPNPAPSLSAPTPGGSTLTDAIAASHTPVSSSSNLPSTPLPKGNVPSPPVSRGDVDAIRTQEAASERKTEELKKEATNLEDILRNQAKPNNLVAVKKSGTPVLSSPNEGAQQLFLADAEDEFEILDMNASWVHVRISGLSRGWIRRSSLELPEDTPEGSRSASAAANQPAAAKPASSGAPFEKEKEETATFPGDWDPLRGKTVKILTFEKVNARGSSAQAKLDFIKSVLADKEADAGKNSASEGVVIIFDSEDGGMMATTLPVLRQWRAGTISDSALWQHSYFDPPEAFQP
ncbi:MAG TPA: hypothetical protein VF753_16820 [Terriglobales bacterium]